MEEKVPDVRGIARYLKRDPTNIASGSNVWYPQVNLCVYNPSVATYMQVIHKKTKKHLGSFCF